MFLFYRIQFPVDLLNLFFYEGDLLGVKGNSLLRISLTPQVPELPDIPLPAILLQLRSVDRTGTITTMKFFALPFAKNIS